MADMPTGITVGRLRSILGYAVAEYERPHAKVKARTPHGSYKFIITGHSIDPKTGEVELTVTQILEETNKEGK